jgi:hypothetical protein
MRTEVKVKKMFSDRNWDKKMSGIYQYLLRTRLPPKLESSKLNASQMEQLNLPGLQEQE